LQGAVASDHKTAHYLSGILIGGGAVIAGTAARISSAGLSEAQINEHIAARSAAKQSRNFVEADRIRKELLEAGIVLEDSAAGTTWRRA